MEVKIKGNKVTVVVKTTTVDKEGNPSFGRNTYAQMKELVKVVEKSVSYRSGTESRPSQMIQEVYVKFKKEHLIPLVYAEAEGIRYKGEVITVM